MVTAPMTSPVKAGFFNLRINSGIGSFFVRWGRGVCPVHVGCLEASLGSSTSQRASYDNKNSSRLFQVSLGGRSKISGGELLIDSLGTIFQGCFSGSVQAGVLRGIVCPACFSRGWESLWHLGKVLTGKPRPASRCCLYHRDQQV